MKLIVCLDDQNGMLFNHRRQSKDRAVCERVLQLCRDHGVRMNEYSAKLFPEGADGLLVCNDPLAQAADDAWCFAENIDLLPYADKIKQLVIFRWNRAYPADLHFPMDAVKDRMKLIDSRQFTGSSHSIITEETYTL